MKLKMIFFDGKVKANLAFIKRVKQLLIMNQLF